jgi:hypothetical protein
MLHSASKVVGQFKPNGKMHFLATGVHVQRFLHIPNYPARSCDASSQKGARDAHARRLNPKNGMETADDADDADKQPLIFAHRH